MKLIFAGDLCVSGTKRPTLGDAVNYLIKSSNVVCINLEGPLIDSGTKPKLKVGPSIYQTDLALEVIKDCCATHINLANNHIMDFGVAGLRTTLARLKDLSTIGAGLSYHSAYQASFIQHNGHQIALLCFGEAQFGVLQTDSVDQAGFASIDSPDARKSVQEARTLATWVIVQVHAGLEMVDIPLPEWRARYRELIDLGADIIIGHHPHVLQGAECYKGRMIYYSLGNFYMDTMLEEADSGSGGLLEVVIENGQLSSRIIPLHITLNTIELNESAKAYEAYKLVCDKLIDEVNYLKEVETICESFWIDIYSKYYESALTGLGTKPSQSSSIRLIRKLLAFLAKRRWNEKFNELMIIHNIRIETHRWVVERALSNRALK